MIKNLTGKELEKFKSEFTITGYFAPTVYLSHIDGQKYAICIGAPWIPIPFEMTREDVHARWIKKEVKREDAQFITKVPSSKGKTQYTVSFERKKWMCTCPGFKFKGVCTHITSVKSGLKSKLNERNNSIF